MSATCLGGKFSVLVVCVGGFVWYHNPYRLCMLCYHNVLWDFIHIMNDPSFGQSGTSVKALLD